MRSRPAARPVPPSDDHVLWIGRVDLDRERRAGAQPPEQHERHEFLALGGVWGSTRDGHHQLDVHLRLVIEGHAGLGQPGHGGGASLARARDPLGLGRRSTGSKPEPHEGEAGDSEDGSGEPEREQEELVGRSEEEEDRGQNQLEDARPDEPLAGVPVKGRAAEFGHIGSRWLVGLSTGSDRDRGALDERAGAAPADEGPVHDDGSSPDEHGPDGPATSRPSYGV